MLLIIIGVIFIVIGIIFWLKENVYFLSFNTVLGMVLSSIGIACVCFGLLYPFHGYQEPIFQEEYELEEIFPNTNIYVIESQTGEKIFKCITKGKYEERESIENIYADDQIEIVISKEGVKPVARKYLTKAKQSIFTFALGNSKTEYKIFVTEQNIVK